ncbi:hypothetical protein JAAARDRAFT_29959 [Jaapia argillacea MUCL 33604]|uniref:F-box domain-containing protein n=1 Tax=Jaapia argillacea MUCL 33604 TaxID=933084 RepID=A0A067Q4S3_9AGAM|nr:hypothetical protein JAAARDRAFT_29959 [Jaapia argillacea MUCL 33604]
MHRCLQVPEILSLIFLQVEQEPGGKKTLAALARTCHAFHDPALDVLWYEQQDFSTLLKCMPSDLWNESRIDRHTPRLILKFRRSMLPDDWARFSNHASRIRVLHLGTQFLVSSATSRVIHLTLVDLEVFRLLSIYRPLGVLLPNLRHLHWSYSLEETFPYIHLFPHANLSGLDIWAAVGISDEERTLFLSRLTTTSPKLLRLHSAGTVSVMGLQQVCRIRHLQDISLLLSSLSAAELALLAGLSSLARISIRAQQYQDITVQCLRSHCHEPFVSLRCLMILGLNSESYTALLLWISPSHLQELTCEIDRSTPASTVSFKALIDAVAQSCSPTSLSYLEIIDSAPEPTFPELHLEAASLRPLLAFGNLATVFIDPPIFIVMDNSMLQEMALAWPDLEYLSIGVERRSLRGYEVTLQGLIPLVEHCPRLKNLGVVLHATTKIDAVKPANGVSVSSVKHLKFGRSTITVGRAMEVAAFLSALFPKVGLWSLSAWDDDDAENLDAEVAEEVEDCAIRDAWREVSRAYPLFAMVREQEQRQSQTQTQGHLVVGAGSSQLL